VWQDDSQVARLVVEKLAGERDGIVLAAGPAETATLDRAAETLTALLDAADAARAVSG